MAAVTLDAHVFANSQPEWADVRVLDGAGREVPRVILPERDYTFEQRHTPRAAALKSLEQLPEGGLAVVCEIERTNASRARMLSSWAMVLASAISCWFIIVTPQARASSPA